MADAALILVRHGRPKIDPDTPATSWPLCPEGREAVERLTERLAAYSPQALVSSPEPKAKETAEIIADRLGLEVALDPGLHEHKRQHRTFGTEQEFRQSVAAVFAKPREAVHGGETAIEACDRLAKTLAGQIRQPLIAVTHGTILSLYLAKRLGCDAHDLWRSLHMPDAFVLDASGELIERLG